MADIFRHFLAPDLLVALVLVGIALFVFFAVRVGALPVKGVPFVVGTLLAAVGFGIWRERRARDLQKILREREAVLRQRDKDLDVLRKKYNVSHREAEEALAKRNAEVLALTEEILRIRNIRDDELARLHGMTPAERRDYVLGLELAP